MERSEAQITKEASNKKIAATLKEFWFKPVQIQELLNKHHEDYLLANIAVIEEQINKGKKIKNITAYLAKAFTVDFRPTETEYSRQLALKQEEREAKKYEKSEFEASMNSLQDQYYQEKKQKIDSLLRSFDDTTIEELQTEFLATALEKPAMRTLYEKDGFDNVFIAGSRRDFIGGRFLAYVYQNFENYERSKSESSLSSS